MHIKSMSECNYTMNYSEAGFGTLTTLFTKFLTLGLTRELGDQLDDWLDWLIPTNH